MESGTKGGGDGCLEWMTPQHVHIIKLITLFELLSDVHYRRSLHNNGQKNREINFSFFTKAGFLLCIAGVINGWWPEVHRCCGMMNHDGISFENTFLVFVVVVVVVAINRARWRKCNVNGWECFHKRWKDFVALRFLPSFLFGTRQRSSSKRTKYHNWVGTNGWLYKVSGKIIFSMGALAFFVGFAIIAANFYIVIFLQTTCFHFQGFT